MGKIQEAAIKAHDEILKRRGEITFIDAFSSGYKQAEKEFIERLAEFYPVLDYTFRSYLIQDFPELKDLVKDKD